MFCIFRFMAAKKTKLECASCRRLARRVAKLEGELAKVMDELAKAKKSYQRALQLDGQYEPARSGLARVRVGIGCGRRAVSRPAGVGDADGTRRRLLRQHLDQIAQLALRPAADHPGAITAIVQRAHAGGIIAAIFHAPEAIDQPVDHRFTADDPDNAAHRSVALHASACGAL